MLTEEDEKILSFLKQARLDSKKRLNVVGSSSTSKLPFKRSGNKNSEGAPLSKGKTTLTAEEAAETPKTPRDPARRATMNMWFKMWVPRQVGESHWEPPTPPPGACDRHVLAAFLSYWLSHEVFEYSPSDTVRDDLMIMAVLISRGISFSLAPMFLGGYFNIWIC